MSKTIYVVSYTSYYDEIYNNVITFDNIDSAIDSANNYLADAKDEDAPDVPETYTVTYKAGGGIGKDIVQTYVKGDSIILPGCMFAPQGKKMFDKWQIGDATYNPGDTYVISDNITVTALWKDIPSPGGSGGGGGSAVELAEVFVCTLCKYFGKRGFTHTRRTVKNQVRHFARIYNTP